MIFKPDGNQSLKVHVDADFAGNWDKSIAQHDSSTARSRHGYIISFAGCPIVWKSQLQTEIALSSTESEITGISYALREAIPIMNLLEEMKTQGFPISSSKPDIHCSVLEDNIGAIEITKFPKLCPKTKHINIKLYHFRSYIENK